MTDEEVLAEGVVFADELEQAKLEGRDWADRVVAMTRRLHADQDAASIRRLLSGIKTMCEAARA